MSHHHHLRPQVPDGFVDHVGWLSEDFAQLAGKEVYADITFVVGETSFPSHKVILAARSEYFRALLYGGMKESQPGTTEIELKDTPPFAFSVFLKYIYTGCINLTEIQEEILLDILSLSHRFGFVELESSISDYLKAILSIHNVCPIFDLANMYNLTSLCNVCEDYMDTHTQEVLNSESFLFLSQISVRDVISRDSFCASEMDIFEAVNKWAVHNKDQDPVPVLKAVRFQLMEPHELMHVRDTGLISSDTVLESIGRQTKIGGIIMNYRGFKVVDENVAIASMGASVIRGQPYWMETALLDGDTENYGLGRGFRRHLFDDNIGQSIVIKLGKAFIINTIKLLLWDKDARSYSYYIEVSGDDKDYERVIDHTQYLCRSWQELHFPARVVRYIKVVGTHYTVDRGFHLVSFECSYTSRPFHLEQGLIVPTENVAADENGAYIIEGVSTSPNALIDGDTSYYDWNYGYTCHQIGSGAICIQLAQPYMLSTMRLLLWDLDNRSYSFYIEVSNDQQKWTRVVDKQNELCKSWQTFAFDQIPVTFIRIVGTHNTANESFHCVHIESPAVAVGSAV
ncbi:hypothetical protein BsWGS_10236 [Bradybaena similaris]